MMKKRLCSVLLAFVLLLALLPTVAGAEDGLTKGGTYYFDLSGENLPGNQMGVSLPDETLHYVPFTYVGEIDAYKLTADNSIVTAYAHHLFIADCVVKPLVSWDTLKTANLIFGRNYTSNGATYTMRVPSVGRGGASNHGTPENNEWDKILDAGETYIKNSGFVYSWGQDSDINAADGKRRARGGKGGPRSTDCFSLRNDYSIAYCGFRPVLEVQNSADLSNLKVATLDLTDAKFRSVLAGQAEVSGEIKIVVKIGSTFTAPALEWLEVPAGYDKDSLVWSADNGKTYTPGESVPAEVSRLTAEFTPNTYTVTLDANGGTINRDNVTEYTYGQGATLPADVTKTGYDFLGWYSGNKKVTSIGKTETGNKSFTAKWQASTYTVTLNANGGTITSGDVTGYTYGQSVTLPTEVTREGYTFKGWYDNAAMTGSPVAAISTTDIDNKAYYAKWEPITYTIIYDLDGGKAEGNPETYTIETETITLVNPTKSGYAFTGWSGTDLDGEENMTVTIPAGSTGHRAYTAHWRANRYYYYSDRQTAAPVTSPGTADDSAMGLWGLLLCASLAAGYAVTAAQRRRER